MPIFRFQGSQALPHCWITSTLEVFQISIWQLPHTPGSSERHHFSFLRIWLYSPVSHHPGTKHSRAIHQLIWHVQVPIYCWQSVIWQSPHNVQPPWEMADGLALLGYRIHMSVMQSMYHQLLRWAERVSSVCRSSSISMRRYELQLESVYHAPIWTATGICHVLNMSDYKGFGEAEPWSQDRDLRFESKIREETRCISLGQA